MWAWRVKMPTQNLLRLLLLLMLIMRIVLAKVFAFCDSDYCQCKTRCGCFCCWCWWWGSCWQQFVADLKLRFGHKAKLIFRFWAQGLVKILKLVADVWLRLRSWISVKILKLKILAKPSFRILTNFNFLTSTKHHPLTSESWPNLVLKVWTKV